MDCLKEVLTASEVDQLWNKPQGTTKLKCVRGAFTEEEARKSGGTWLVTYSGAVRVFGNPPERSDESGS
ncbi:helix-turn-helix domain-containing protein [Brevibacillus agri]|jgi:hypothetical protein|uniref:helix-turn-helix domain-containing protein n=1 Tax=Brevibacillus agri TaxID=51101 RepID=UPI0009DD3689